MLALLLALAQGPAPVSYEVTFPNAAHHEAEIVATFPALPAGPLEVWMSRSSPGRYAVHEFAKNVYRLRAEDGQGRALGITALTPYSWRIDGHDGSVRVRYTLFANRGDGTYAQVDRYRAQLNMPAVFLWARGLELRAMRLRFPALPAGWRVATQLKPTADPATFSAPNLQLFMDSPTSIGPFALRTWLVTNGARIDTIRVAMHHLGSDAELDQYVAVVKRIVQEEAGVFGELPAFDWGTYTFIANYLPWASGDGMEHRNSTSLSSTRPLSAGMSGHLGTVAHEFFHAWNIERIRPRSLEPFDFTRANMSGELWLGEGFTNYYDALAVRRAGLTDDAGLARALSGEVNAVINAPGRRLFSAVDMSRQAPFVDAATSIDPQNKSNTFISYYTFGQAIATGLDLTIRSRFPGRSLDDFMQAMWRSWGKTEIPYTLEDARQTLAAVVGDRAFAEDYFRRYIAGQEVPDYAALFATVGFVLRLQRPGAAWWGDASFTADSGRLIMTSNALIGQPLYAAGVENGDVITSLDGRTVASIFDTDSILARHRPGDTIPIEFQSRSRTVRAALVLAENPRLDLVPGEAAGVAVTPGALENRRRWLASKAGPQGAPR